MAEITKKQYTYSHEIETILVQFVAMIDKCIVHRYEKDPKTFERKITQRVSPQYTFGSKSRTLYFLTNKAKNIVYPVVVINLKNIKMNTERLQDKWNNIYRKVDDDMIESYDKPIPITLTLTVNIIAMMQTDLYQIWGHIARQFKPSQFYSWCVPGTRAHNYEEQRNKVTWNGDFDIETRDKLQETEEDVYKGSMNFEVEGWLYPEEKKEDYPIITDIGTTVPIEPDTYYRTTNEYGEYLPFVLGVDTPTTTNPREWSNGHPRILLSYLKSKDYRFGMMKDLHTVFNHEREYEIELHGYNMKNAKVYLIPKEEHGLPVQELSFTKVWYSLGTKDERPDTISGIELSTSLVSDNKMIVTIPKINYTGQFDIAVATALDYDTLNNSKGFLLKMI